MLYSYLVAIGVITTLTTVWLAVQIAHRRAFPDASPDEDLLAGKAGCGSCSEHQECERANESSAWRRI